MRQIVYLAAGRLCLIVCGKVAVHGEIHHLLEMTQISLISLSAIKRTDIRLSKSSMIYFTSNIIAVNVAGFALIVIIFSSIISLKCTIRNFLHTEANIR